MPCWFTAKIGSYLWTVNMILIVFFFFFGGLTVERQKPWPRFGWGWSGSQWILRQKSCQFWGEDFANQWQVWWGFSWVTTTKTVTTKRPRENRGLVTSNHRDLMMIQGTNPKNGLRLSSLDMFGFLSCSTYWLTGGSTQGPQFCQSNFPKNMPCHIQHPSHLLLKIASFMSIQQFTIYKRHL